MKYLIIEAAYPLKFRVNDASILANHLINRHSVEIVGIKRVGIHNFLRFYLFQVHVEKKYIHNVKEYISILVDLNDLVELDLFAFWRLTLKRILDAVESNIENTAVKELISAIFLKCIQSGDFFLTYDGVRESLLLLAKEGFYPTLFFSRFDRLKDIASIEFFDNLKSIRDATGQKLAYVFTSFRQLSEVFPSSSNNELISRFLNTVYIKPLTHADQKIILDKLSQKYSFSLPQAIQESIFFLSAGHIQYMHLCFLIAYEQMKNKKGLQKEMFMEDVKSDERIEFLSEELWDSLTEKEQNVLKKLIKRQQITKEDKTKTMYLWDTGLILGKKEKQLLFSPLFHYYVEYLERNDQNITSDLSKKEYMLFQYLKNNIHEICGRENIALVVWPEYAEYGVSDWAIDRLVARLRSKLKKQKSEYEIVTIRTKGYKLITQ